MPKKCCNYRKPQKKWEQFRYDRCFYQGGRTKRTHNNAF